MKTLRKWGFISLALVASGACITPALAQTTLPTVTVTAPRVGGGNVLCYGSDGCAMVIADLMQQAQQDLMDQMQPIDDAAIPGPQFCSELRGKKPASCPNTPPSAPGFTPNWQGNGCGPASAGTWLTSAFEAIGNIAAPQFSGDRNSPFPGVSFLSACNAHDACYATSGNRTQCDGAFDTAMRNACSASLVGDPRTICNSFAAAYFTAVAQFGQSAYTQAQANQQCAAWHYEMTRNQCPK